MGHLFLVGFMGAGKSTVARLLSERIGVRSLDTDEMAVALERKPIAKIFAQNGEGYFRRLEHYILERLQEKEPAIISCGGGMAIRRENVELMKTCGHIVYLKASPETILKRVSHTTHRPLLEGKKTVPQIAELMEGRIPYYQEAADFTIEVDHKELSEIVTEIENLKII